MKVRITHGQGSFWYEHKVGEVFEVEDEMLYGDYKVKGVERCIAIEDGEVVEDDVYIGQSISSTGLMSELRKKIRHLTTNNHRESGSNAAFSVRRDYGAGRAN